jgi:signal transduction histidine kinase
MIDTGQLLERFRLLSRDIQNGFQTAQKQLEPLKKGRDGADAGKLALTLGQMSEAWQDFAGWVLVSTLDNTEEARSNCAPGRVDVQSKITRSKLRRHNDALRNGITIDASDTQSIVIETFIPYFEQLLDLLYGNAIKYSPRGGTIEIACSRARASVNVSIRSVGPMVAKHELPQLGEREFRAEQARKLPVTGQGYGLFNCKRLAELLGAGIDFRPEQKVLYESAGVQYANFAVSLNLPESVRD